jgi:hypothetical protein
MLARPLQWFKLLVVWVVVTGMSTLGMAQVPGAGRDGVYSRCNGFPYPVCVECAMGTRCDSLWSSGGCRDYARYEVCGYGVPLSVRVAFAGRKSE